MPFLSASDPRKQKPKAVQQQPEVPKDDLPKKYPVGDGKIKNPADYFDEKTMASDDYNPGANPTSIALSSRCHPQEVFQQARVKLYDPEAHSLGYALQTMLKCHKHGRLARKHGDYERACALFARAIGLALVIPTHPNYHERFGEKGEQGLKQFKDEAVKEAAALADVINARFFYRKRGAEANTQPCTTERPTRDVWFDLAGSWRAVKDTITKPQRVKTPDLVVQNLGMEEAYVTPPAVHQGSTLNSNRRPSGSLVSSQPTSHPPRQQRRSSISKVDKDLPPPPKETQRCETDYSFKVEYTDSPLSATAPLQSWDEDEDDAENPPSYGEVILEAYANDPSPPALVLALRNGRLAEGDMPLLSGRNLSVVSLNIEDVTGGSESVYHSAASSAPPSDSEDGPFYSAMHSNRSSIHEGETKANKSGGLSQKSDDKRELARTLMEEERKKPYPKEKATSELAVAEHTRLFERELEAALKHLESIAKARANSLPNKSSPREVITTKTRSTLDQINKLLGPER